MKKIIMIIIALTVSPTFATTMCAVDDSVAVVLDPSLGITNGSLNSTMGTWWAWNTQGTVYGISACLNRSSGSGSARLTDTNNGETHVVNGSERYGRYCWCKLTHPVVSRWVFNRDWSNAATCASARCPDSCKDSFKNDSNSLRWSLFGSVAQ